MFEVGDFEDCIRGKKFPDARVRSAKEGTRPTKFRPGWPSGLAA